LPIAIFGMRNRRFSFKLFFLYIFYLEPLHLKPFLIMSYLVLAVNAGPRFSEEVLGQGHVTQNHCKTPSRPAGWPCYLFSGPRGWARQRWPGSWPSPELSGGPTPVPCNHVLLQ